MNHLDLWKSKIRAIKFEEPILDCHETHQSLVLLSKNYAFKFKKSVNFGFVDYSTFEKRFNAACLELRLNKALSTDVYLELVYFKADQHEFIYAKQFTDPELDLLPQGYTQADEICVVMRRLDQEKTLLSLLRNNLICADIHLKPLAFKLADFFKKRPAKNLDYLGNLQNFVAGNFKDLYKFKSVFSQFEVDAIEFLEKSALNFLLEHRSMLTERIQGNKLVDGHGDLRLEHVYYEGKQIQIIDCIEFSQILRENDIAAEVGFLLMELDYRKCSNYSRILLEAFKQKFTDPQLEMVLPFFKCYRSLVRAKVHLLRSAQLKDPANEVDVAKAHINLALRYSLGLEESRIILVAGLMGSGKTTLAHKLSRLFYCPVYSSDVIRKEIFKTAIAQRPETKKLAFGTGIYDQAATNRTYSELLTKAKSSLDCGSSVIIDASFLKHSYRQDFINLAEQRGLPISMIECKLEIELQRKRLLERADGVSDGRVELVEAQSSSWEAIHNKQKLKHIELDTSNEIDFRCLSELAPKL